MRRHRNSKKCSGEIASDIFSFLFVNLATEDHEDLSIRGFKNSQALLKKKPIIGKSQGCQQQHIWASPMCKKKQRPVMGHTTMAQEELVGSWRG
jgi:hypothetical protein